MAMLQFNGTDITPAPSEMSVTVQDVSSSDSGRGNKDAVMHKVVIAQKRTIHLGWNNPTNSEVYNILRYLRSGYNGQSQYVQVKYDGDPFTTGTQTRVFYYGDISAALQQVWVGNRKRYSKLTFDLIEV